MDYAKNYLKAKDLADIILENVQKGKTPSGPTGLGSKIDTDRSVGRSLTMQENQKDLQEITASYLASLDDIFNEAEENLPETPISESAPLVSQRPRKRIEGSIKMGEADDIAQGNYPEELTQRTIEEIIEQEAAIRGIDPTVAIGIFRAEGAGNYQSQIAREGKGSAGGLEASYGPYQLYKGGGLGNEYEQATGRQLETDNTIEGITSQIRFALDNAATGGWGPWYGRRIAGIGVRDGLEGAKPVYNWKVTN